MAVLVPLTQSPLDPKSPCPKGMMQWIHAVDCGAREEARAQGSAPLVASS